MYERAKYCLEDHLFGRLHEFLHWHGGGLLPEQLDLSNVRSVLDVACGSGEWVLDMAFAYPQVQYMGLDNDAPRISYARACARVLGLENVDFMLSDMFCMALPDNYCDLVHGRFLSTALLPITEQHLYAELLRVCAPRGRVVLSELLYPWTNSAACNCWCEYLRQAIECSRRMVGKPATLSHVLYDAGWRSVRSITTTIDISYGSTAHKVISTKAWEMMQFIKPFFLHYGVVSEKHLEQLSTAILIDIDKEAFEGECSLVAYVGRK